MEKFIVIYQGHDFKWHLFITDEGTLVSASSVEAAQMTFAATGIPYVNMFILQTLRWIQRGKTVDDAAPAIMWRDEEIKHLRELISKMELR